MDGSAKPSPGSAATDFCFLRPTLVSDAVCLGVLAVISGVFVVAVFGWEARELLVGVPLGALTFGAVDFFFNIRKRLPTQRPPAVPYDATIEPGSGFARSVLALAVVLPLCIGLAWLADHWDLGAIFVPGQLTGYTCAALLGAWLATRWEARHGDRLVIAFDDEGEETLYISAPWRPATAARGAAA